jgi:hypothetical protein
VLQIVDEAGRFVPQNPPKGADDIARCIGAIEQLVELGRNVGVGVMLVTQRSARMAKSVSELAECMIAFRTVGPRSVDAILDWFGEHVEKSRRPALLEQLRQLPRGRALVVSPGWLEYEDAVTFRARRTFDSSATPTEAERRMVKLAPAPDRLEAFRTKLAETVDRAKRDDPRELRKALAAAEKTAAQYANTIAQLEKTVAALRAKPVQASPAPLRPRTDRELAAVARLKDRFTERVTRLETAFHADVTAMLELGRQIARLEQQLLARLTAAPPVKAAQPVPATSRVPGITESVNHSPQPRLVNHEVAPAWVTAGPDSSLLDSRQQPKKHVRRLLTVLAQHAPRRFKRDAWYRLSGYKPSGDISTAVAALLERRFVTDDAGFGITVAGLELLGPFEPLPVGAALREHLLQKSSTLERRLLGVWFSAYPSALTRTEAFAAAQYKPSGDTSTAVAKFLTVGWLDDLGGGKLRASEDFYA